MKLIIIFLIILSVLAIGGCAFRGTITQTEHGMVAESNRPMELSKTVDKDGSVIMEYSSKKSRGWLENLLTILGLRAVKGKD